ncbi:iron-sulfur flavoprotein [Methanosarcina siciliae C2J]|uniref:Iron-sulfur flavoprotein n=3 Tax=Methanosarcina siciliae TaxID=38027 RepID=A0A0E3PBS4_9EURY|nr:flavodoxin family protein [Methanosarcina siciliae]AKB27790.1 iron-sulfur flavoprotein [Methanosarcina siciliae T4/M]AKB31714.1 iron-sulfur flavoprotein [Methanosarcina siciliae HI350]AKB37785.1 iron-sulfur flavoprotein [Methanosarcina siciliae C2J]
MKILGISGSPRRGQNCEKMIGVALKLAKEKGFETETFFLSNKDIAPCKACGTCREKDSCVIDDDMEKVYEKMKAADGIIVAAPVYMGNYPAQLKALFDRSVLLRRKDFALKDKVGAALSIGGSRNGGQEKTIQSIHDWMHIHGMIVVGDNAHFGGIAWNPAEGDAVGMQTVSETAKKLCDVLELIRKK